MEDTGIEDRRSVTPRSDPHTEALIESRDALEALAGRLSMEPTADDLAQAVDALLDAANTATKLWACEIREEANDARAVAAEARVTQLAGKLRGIAEMPEPLGDRNSAAAAQCAWIKDELHDLVNDLGVVADGGDGRDD